MDLARYTTLFLADTREHLRTAGAVLLDWEGAPDRSDLIPEVFRAFHSVKGAAATMGYGSVADLAHAAESLLEAVRSGELPPSNAVIGLLLRSVDVLERDAEAAVEGGSTADAPALAEALARMATTGSTRPSTPGATARPATRPSGAFNATGRLVRVEPARLDDLLLRSGELVVAWNRLEAHARGSADPELEAIAGQMGSLVRATHTGVLRARLAPVTDLFDRVPRLVRDLTASLGRRVTVEVRRDSVDLDRGMLEALVDPLVHLVRNAVDHGIEPPAERKRLGKVEQGCLTFAAERQRDWVVLSVSDDGRGIDVGRVADRAVSLGLRATDEQPPGPDELLTLLARPGFSLKSEVSEVSGRGVGMDVVVTTVRALGGRVELESRAGTGTTFRLVVPLTTAIQRVLLVGVNRRRFAIPFRLVLEASLPEAVPPATMTTGSGFRFRTDSLPMVDLAGAVGEVAPTGKRRPVLVLEWGPRRGALVVDSLLGQMDVRIERVEAPVGLPAWVNGATILADGSPAFVLDPTALFGS